MNPPIKIAIDLTALLPETTGVDNYLNHLVVHLGQIDEKNQYRIFVNYEDRHLFSGLLPDNLRVIPSSLRPRPIRLLFQQAALPVLALKWNADVVHSPSFIMPFYRGRQRHLLTIYDMTSFTLPECHTALHRSIFYRQALLRSIMRADLITVPSRATEREILARVPQLAADRIRLVVPGIGDEFRVYDSHIVRRETERLGLPQSYILSVGTIEPRKNLARLVEAYIRLVRQGGSEAHLVLVGRLGWNYEDVLSRLKVPELGAKIHLTGYVSGSDLPWYYAAARLFVYPSLQEGFGFPPLEAMACGVPVVSSLSTSLVENLRGAAELVEPDNVESLTSAIRKLLCDEGLRDERKKLGLERASRFRWAETARQTLECYSDLSGAI